MNLQSLLVTATALSMAAVVPALAQSTNVNFSLTEGGQDVAGGSFSFLSAKTGLLDYSDLTSFSYFNGANSFDLASVLANSTSRYQYLGYDTGSTTFTPTTVDGFTFYLTSIAPDFNSGFYTSSEGDKFTYDYATQRFQNFSSISVNSTGGLGAVPEPATWAMMLIGFGLIGFCLRQRNKPTANLTYA